MKGSVYAGTLPEQAMRDLSRINPSFIDDAATISNHGIFSRFDKDGWSPERIADAYASLLNSGSTRGVPNFQGFNRSAKEALWLPDDPMSIFAPTVPARRGGANIVTMYEPETKKVLSHLENFDWPSGERHTSISGLHRTLSAGVPSSQQRRLSAVEGHDGINDIDSKNKVKALLPYVFGGSLAAGMAPGDAQAAPVPSGNPFPNGMSVWDALQAAGVVTPDLPLEQPIFDPVDNIIALLTGPAGMGGKAAAGAMETPLPFAFDKVVDEVGKGYDWTRKQLQGVF